MAYTTKLYIGKYLSDKIVKQYGKIVYNPFDGVTDHCGFTFLLESNETLKFRINPAARYGNDLSCEEIIWCWKTEEGPDKKFLVSLTSKSSLTKWKRDSMLRTCVPYCSEEIKAAFVKDQRLDSSFVTNGIDKFLLDRKYKFVDHFSSLCTNEQIRLKKEFAAYCKENKLTKEQIKAHKAEIKKSARKEVLGEKAIIYIAKESDVVTRLMLTLNGIVDDCNSLQDYLSDPRNKININHAESKLRNLKNVSSTIKDLATLSEKQKQLLITIEDEI